MNFSKKNKETSRKSAGSRPVVACLCTDLQILWARISQEKLREHQLYSQSGNHPFGLIQCCPKRIGYEAKGFEAEWSHLAELEGPANSPCGFRSKTERYLVYLAWPDGKHWGKRFAGVVFWVCEDPNWPHEVEIGHSLRLQNYRKHFQIGSGITIQKRWCLFSDYKKIFQFSSWPRWFWELNAGNGSIHCYIFLRLIDDFLPNQLLLKRHYGVGPRFLAGFRTILGYYPRRIWWRGRAETEMLGLFLPLSKRDWEFTDELLSSSAPEDLIARMNWFVENLK